VPCVDAFDDPDFRFSIDWDGARTLLFASPGAIRLQSETLADVSDRYPEIVIAAEPLAPRTVVLDGVVAVLDPRLATASYRGVLLSTLPPMRRSVDLSEVESFLRRPLEDSAP